MVSALVWRVLTTANLYAKGWWEVKSRYLSVWVGFLYTVVAIDPSTLCSSKTLEDGVNEGLG